MLKSVLLYKNFTQDALNQSRIPIVTVTKHSHPSNTPLMEMTGKEAYYPPTGKWDILILQSTLPTFHSVQDILSKSTNENITFLVPQRELKHCQFQGTDKKARSFIILCEQGEQPNSEILHHALKLAHFVEFYIPGQSQLNSFKSESNVLIHCVEKIDASLVKRIINTKKIGCTLATLDGRLRVVDPSDI